MTDIFGSIDAGNRNLIAQALANTQRRRRPNAAQQAAPSPPREPLDIETADITKPLEAFGRKVLAPIGADVFKGAAKI
jgi:hypothetical protein